ncbi:MAG: hypothetical protein ACK4NQ_01615 [Fimbriimonadaceae bacterium]
MNQDLTQSNLSITRDGVTINISGPAWLIKDVYDRETGNPIRVEQATPEAPATPKEWPWFNVGDRVRYAGSDRLGTIERADKRPRIYTVWWDDDSYSEHVGVALEKVGGEPVAEPEPQAPPVYKSKKQPNWRMNRTPEEPTIEALAHQEPGSKGRRGIKNYWARLTPEERKERIEKMRAARCPNKVPAPVHAGAVQDDGLVRFGNGVVSLRPTVGKMSVGQQVFIPGAAVKSVYNAASGHGFKIRTKVTQKGVLVWRVQ